MECSRCWNWVGLPAAFTGLILLPALGCSKRPTLPEVYPVEERWFSRMGKLCPAATFNSNRRATRRFRRPVRLPPTEHLRYTVSSMACGRRCNRRLPSRDRLPGGSAPSTLPRLYSIKPEDNEVTLTLPSNDCLIPSPQMRDMPRIGK